MQIFYKGMLNYLAQETVDQILPRLNDLLQINGEKTTFFVDFIFNKRLQLILGLRFMESFSLRKEVFLIELKKFRHWLDSLLMDPQPDNSVKENPVKNMERARIFDDDISTNTVLHITRLRAIVMLYRNCLCLSSLWLDDT